MTSGEAIDQCDGGTVTDAEIGTPPGTVPKGWGMTSALRAAIALAPSKQGEITNSQWLE